VVIKLPEIGAREFLLGFVTISILFSGSYITLAVTQTTHLPSSVETRCTTSPLASRIFFSLLLTSIGMLIAGMARKEAGFLFPIGLLVVGIAIFSELVVFPYTLPNA